MHNSAECKLCLSKQANKKNSHIIPKAISKKWHKLQTNGVAHRINTESISNTSDFVQDSPKEDFIFCESCEIKISRIESYSMKHWFNKIKSDANTHEFSIERYQKCKIKECLNLDPIAFRLFLYSIVWRAHISNHLSFKDFKLECNEAENLRIILDSYLDVDHSKTLANCKIVSKHFKFYPFVLWIEAKKSNKRDFLLFNPYLKNPYLLNIYNFRVHISFNGNKQLRGRRIAINDKNENIKILIKNKLEWEKETYKAEEQMKEWRIEYLKKNKNLLNHKNS